MILEGRDIKINNTKFNLNDFAEARKTFRLFTAEDIENEVIYDVVDNINLIEAKLLILMLLEELSIIK